jgi:L-asparaginase
LEAARIAEDAAHHGAEGIVVVQGTDTIDEVAFALDLLLDMPTPVVVTGAMRNPSMAGADGLANLLAAAIVASSVSSLGLGVTVVLNDEVHIARCVEKGHSALPSAFSSTGAGPVGEVIEGAFRPLWRQQDSNRDFGHKLKGFADVALVAVALDDNGKMLDLVAEARFAGVVIEAMGGGHLPERTLASVDRLSAKMPVVLAKRMPGGPVLRNTYGFKGSERDLLSKGVIPAGRLSATKARLLLAAMIDANASREEIRTAFDTFS